MMEFRLMKSRNTWERKNTLCVECLYGWIVRENFINLPVVVDQICWKKNFKKACNDVDLVLCVTVVVSLKWLTVPIMTSRSKTTAQKFFKPSYSYYYWVKKVSIFGESIHEEIYDLFFAQFCLPFKRPVVKVGLRTQQEKWVSKYLLYVTIVLILIQASTNFKSLSVPLWRVGPRVACEVSN